MNLADTYKNTDKTLFSFELLPPLKGEHFEQLEEGMKPLLEFNPACINITYHQPEVEYAHLPDGSIARNVVRKRPGTVGTAAAIQFKTGIQAVPHIICGGATKAEIENALIDLHFLGIHNLLVLRGDPPKGQKSFQAETDGHAFASELVEQVVKLNNGLYLDENLANSHPTNFCIGVAGYPEKHAEAPNMEKDIENLKRKVDAGAAYIVTQMFYDNNKFFAFVDQCRALGIDVPIVPGLKPLSTRKQLSILPQTFHIDLPADLVKAVEQCKNNKEIRQVGIEWGVAQAKELIAAGVPALHFYTMGKSDNVQRIAAAVF